MKNEETCFNSTIKLDILCFYLTEEKATTKINNFNRMRKCSYFQLIHFLLPSVQRASAFTSSRTNTALSCEVSLSTIQTARIRRFQTKPLTKTMSPSNETFDSYPLLWQWASHDSDTFHHFTDEETTLIRSALLKWYRENRRKLPWRGDRGPFDGSTAGIATSSVKAKKKALGEKAMKGQKDLTSFFNATKQVSKTGESNKNLDSGHDDVIEVTGYSVWVSEIMLQQTRVEAVIPFYLKWMKSFPTVHHLANASDDEVNAHWAGLGFYRRARLLHQGAKYVVNELNGTIPSDVDSLLKISGIGPYTANAIASIAFDQCVPVVDGNVCRVLSRLKGVANHIKAPIFKDNIGWTLAEQIVKAGDGKHAGEVNQALMELGATYCAPSGSGIDNNDPLKDFYMSTRLGIQMDGFLQDESLEISDLTSVLATNQGSTKCALCEKDAIQNILFQLSDDIVSSLNGIGSKGLSRYDVAAKAGHAIFPTDPPKKSKREEVLSVVAMFHNGSEKKKWLMVKRKKDGLLAGQWEFPAKCIWSSEYDAEKSKRKGDKGSIEIPSFDIDIRRNGINKELLNYTWQLNGQETTMNEIWATDSTKKSSIESPIEHIFSHVRWSMYCDFADVTSAVPTSMINDKLLTKDGREYRFMSEDDMKEVGITSSVKKCLSAINAQAGMSKRRKLN